MEGSLPRATISPVHDPHSLFRDRLPPDFNATRVRVARRTVGGKPAIHTNSLPRVCIDADGQAAVAVGAGVGFPHANNDCVSGPAILGSIAHQRAELDGCTRVGENLLGLGL